MMRVLFFILLTMGLVSCASKPPVQAMAEARAAVQSVRPFYQNNYQNKGAKHTKAYRHYQSAEESLLAASQALDKKRYELAKKKAHEAKRHARMAAKLK